jgi:sugar (pentulose or hexulose) kinase
VFAARASVIRSERAEAIEVAAARLKDAEVRFRVCDGETLSEKLPETGHIRGTGGFARIPLWRRILAGTFGREIGFTSSPEGSSLGAALLGMVALGLLDSLDSAADLVRVTETERPDSAEAAAYLRLLPISESAYDALVPVFDELAQAAVHLPLRATSR